MDAEKRIVELTVSYDTELAELKLRIDSLSTLNQTLQQENAELAAQVHTVGDSTPLHRASSTAQQSTTKFLETRSRPSAKLVTLPQSVALEQGQGQTQGQGLGVSANVSPGNSFMDVSPDPSAEKPSLSRQHTPVRVLPPRVNSPDVARATSPVGLSSHSFSIGTLPATTSCCYCTSLLRGLVRQAEVCATCQYACHPACRAALADGHERCPSRASRPSADVDPENVRMKLVVVRTYEIRCC